MVNVIHKKGDVLQIRINTVRVSCLVIEKTTAGEIQNNDLLLLRKTTYSLLPTQKRGYLKGSGRL